MNCDCGGELVYQVTIDTLPSFDIYKCTQCGKQVNFDDE